MKPALLGLDIGGANLKAVHSSGAVRVQPFPLWKHPHLLADQLRRLFTSCPEFDTLAVTMTGELCDCYAGKRAGVLAILDAATQAADAKQLLVWSNHGTFVDLDRARNDPMSVAAANWLAEACCFGRWAPHGSSLLIDIGSTTTDVIPILHGTPVPLARNDPERLRAAELLYTGARRSPLCSLMGIGGAAEFFATTLDLYLVLGIISQDESDCDTADSRPATHEYAHTRLARMMCADLETSTHEERIKLAEKLLDVQLDALADCIRVVSSRLPLVPTTLIVAGSGEFLVELLLRRGGRGVSFEQIISAAEKLSPEQSAAACAYALTSLLRERRLSSTTTT